MTRRLIVGTAAYVTVRLLIALAVGPVRHPDTPSYRAGVSLLGSADRPWVVPAVYAILRDNWLIVAVQAAVSALAFVALAVALGGTIANRRLRVGLIALVPGLGLAPRVTSWDSHLSSESLAISATALLLVALLRVGRLHPLVLAAVFAAWVFTRDAHTFLGVFVVAGVAGWGWTQRRWVAPVLLLVVLGWAYVAGNNNRWVEGYNVTSNLSERVMHNEDHLDWFRDHGMPSSRAFLIEDRVMRWRALYYSDAAMREWAQHDGYRLYMQFLLEHPGEMWTGIERLVISGEPDGESVVDHSYTAVHADPIGPGFVWPKEASLYTLYLMALACGLTAVVGLRHGLDRRWVVPAVIGISTIPHAVLAYVSSPFELARHGVILSFLLVVAAWWTVAVSIDRLLASRAGRSVDHRVVQVEHLLDGELAVVNR